MQNEFVDVREEEKALLSIGIFTAASRSVLKSYTNDRHLRPTILGFRSIRTSTV